MDTQNGDLFDQIKVLAPTVHALVNSRQARITAAVTSHDVVNGYGRGFTFHLKIEILIEQCVTCSETQYTKPQFDCPSHRFERRFMQIADSEAPTLERAWVKLESAMTIRERVAM
jgi:hypothetical protein